MRKQSSQHGFTLVELLVVMVIMGIVVMAVYSLFQNNQKSSMKQDAIVELQQNLRIAMEQMRKDILMAGFMCPLNTGIQSAPNQAVDYDNDGSFTGPDDLGSAFTIRTTSTMGIGVRMDISAQFDSPNDPTGTQTIQVATPEMARLLAKGNYVRIIRPGDFQQPVNRVLTVTAPPTTTTPPSVTVKGFNAVGTYRTGYMIVRVLDPDTTDSDPNTNPPASPCTIQYYLAHDTNSGDPAQMVLERNPSDGSRIEVAGNITDLRFSYLLDDGTEQNTVSGTTLENIRAIRVTLTGATDAKRSAGAGGVTTRTLSTVVDLRNR